MFTSRASAAMPATLPFAVILLAWLIAPHVLDYPEYLLPSVENVLDRFVESTLDLSLPTYVAQSLLRLALGLIIGNAIAIPLAIAIALNRYVYLICCCPSWPSCNPSLVLPGSRWQSSGLELVTARSCLSSPI